MRWSAGPGLVVLLASLHACNLIAAGMGELAVRLLAPPEEPTAATGESP